MTKDRAATYIPDLDSEQLQIHNLIKNRYPFIQCCFWSTKILNEFMVHQPGRFYSLIEVEKDAMEAVFLFLREKYDSFLFNPTADIIDKYGGNSKSTWIVKPLISEAPVQIIQGVMTTTLEKVLVDILSDKSVFSAFQGAEMQNIFWNAMAKYKLNHSRILRYASRRNRKKEIESLISKEKSDKELK